MEAGFNQSDANEELGIGNTVWLRALKYTFYAVIFLISLPGNLMVCAIITRRRKMKTVTNYLILNLAISDIFYTMYVPLDIAVSESASWPFGEFFCKIFYPLMTLSICASALTLMSLALSRFWAVVFPLRRQVSVRQIKITISIIWLLSIVEVIPYVISLNLTSFGSCDETWPSEQSRKSYTVILFLLQFAIPLTAITFTYTMVGLELKNGNRRTENRSLEQRRNEETKKIIRMLIFVTVAFAICNLPSTIMWLIHEFGSEISGFDDIIFFFNILDFGNAAVNPCIYLTCNDDFKREFGRYLKKIKRSFSLSQSNNGEREQTVLTATTVLLKETSLKQDNV